MENKEMLKKQIMNQRIVLAMLLANARQVMGDSAFRDVESKVRRLHLYDNNNDLEGSLQATEVLITELEDV